MSTTFSNEPARAASALPERDARGWSALFTLLRGSIRLYRLWREALEKRRELHGLTALDERTLGDIGVTRSELGWRASQPFWSQPKSLDQAPRPPAKPVIPFTRARRRSGVPLRR